MLEADSIRLFHRGRAVLNSVYLRLDVGKPVALLGASGSGKTSLLLLIYGLLQSEGMVRINGTPEPKLYQKPHLLRFLPQESMMPKTLGVKTALQHFGVSEYQFLMDFPECRPLLNGRFGTLSGGERKLIGLYAMLRQKSPYLLLDEPFSGISPVFVERFIMLMMQESKRKAILFTDHQHIRAHAVPFPATVYFLREGNLSLEIEKS